MAIQRPVKTYGTRAYVTEAAAAPNQEALVLANEVDADLDLVYAGYNAGPTGVAGGRLTGTYPSPGLAADVEQVVAGDYATKGTGVLKLANGFTMYNAQPHFDLITNEVGIPGHDSAQGAVLMRAARDGSVLFWSRPNAPTPWVYRGGLQADGKWNVPLADNIVTTASMFAGSTCRTYAATSPAANFQTTSPGAWHLLTSTPVTTRGGWVLALLNPSLYWIGGTTAQYVRMGLQVDATWSQIWIWRVSAPAGGGYTAMPLPGASKWVQPGSGSHTFNVFVMADVDAIAGTPSDTGVCSFMEMA